MRSSTTKKSPSKSKWLFPASLEEAKESQKAMAQRLVLDAPLPQTISCIGGMDVSHLPFDPEKKIFAANVLLSYPDLSLIETATSAETQDFPYIPGFLGFREAPSLVHAFERLQQRPDVILVDGHGFSHPRQLGIAGQIGVLLDIPTIGVAKSILIGNPEGKLGDEKGSRVPLMWKGQRVATMLRTKRRCSPLIISAGHKISLEAAEELVMTCLAGYKLPEPTRHAHLAANACRLQKW